MPKVVQVKHANVCWQTGNQTLNKLCPSYTVIVSTCLPPVQHWNNMISSSLCPLHPWELPLFCMLTIHLQKACSMLLSQKPPPLSLFSYFSSPRSYLLLLRCWPWELGHLESLLPSLRSWLDGKDMQIISCKYCQCQLNAPIPVWLWSLYGLCY